jgi:hypothetical protein
LFYLLNLLLVFRKRKQIWHTVANVHFCPASSSIYEYSLNILCVCPTCNVYMYDRERTRGPRYALRVLNQDLQRCVHVSNYFLAYLIRASSSSSLLISIYIFSVHCRNSTCRTKPVTEVRKTIANVMVKLYFSLFADVVLIVPN